MRRGFRSDPLTKAKEEIEALEVTRALAMAERQAVDNPELEWAESRVVAVRSLTIANASAAESCAKACGV